ncbi:uncharacterized protein LOC115384222 [Salarias fasciatus]|uniref:uncharacterized protein LOC115384222 n=1 Tax=Salarias fasciatus TaxID=181472 RepID=UPI00117682D7|nr:uncharacterized protein LOC115384222 [Salarias fasciatus]
MDKFSQDPRFKRLLERLMNSFPSSAEVLFKKLQGLVANIKWTPEEVTDLFDALKKRLESTLVFGRSYVWMLEILHWIEINYITPTWRSEAGKTLLDLIQDQTVSTKNLKKFLEEEKEKQLDEILDEIRQEKLNQVDEELLEKVKNIVSSVAADEQPPLNDRSELSNLKRTLQRICGAVKLKMKYSPRLTQMVSWCLLALSKTGRLIQVATGEGKSCIIAMFAAFRAQQGQNVDIITSSEVLAKRDLDEWKPFFEEMDITADCNTTKLEEDLKKCYECQVVYGTVQQFAGDWLRQRFERKDILGKREFQCAIVDEVDSLMLDNGHHVVYLETDMPALQHLNPLLALIWATVGKNHAFPQDQPDNQQNTLINGSSVLQMAEEVFFTPCQFSHDKHTCHIPSFLSNLVNSQLKVWIQNALRAQTMTENDEYVIEKHGIVPVDYSNTGVVENGRQWTDGLQQFLELKHGAKMTSMAVITNYMSSIGLFQMYGNQIYGMSGTLGQQVETEALQKIYKGINTCKIPIFRRRKLFEVEAKVVNNDTEWIETICDVIIEQTRSTSFRGKRAALVICETINHAKTLEKALKNKGSNGKLYINNNMDNEAVLKRERKPGEVLIATNLAGRGTDLKVSESVKKAGGLFVVQTFFPKNARVEAQAFGRTARQGSPGSAQLIICTKHLSKLQQRLVKENQSLKVVKGSRDIILSESLSTYLESVVQNIKKKEALFSQYLDVLDDLYRSADNKPAASDVSALHQFWGMWLITDYKDSDCIEYMRSKLAEDLSAARRKLNQRESPLSNPNYYTAFGNELRRNGNVNGCIEMYTKAIQEDPCWAAVALYNRAFAYLTQQSREQDHLSITRTLEDLKNASNSVQLYCEQIRVTRIYYTQSKRSPDSQPSRFEQQLVAREKVLQLFTSNIKKAQEMLHRLNDFGETLKIQVTPLSSMAPANVLLVGGVRGRQIQSAVRSGDHLRILQIHSDPSLDIFIEFRSLESLGLTYVYSLDTVSFVDILSIMGSAIIEAFD